MGVAMSEPKAYPDSAILTARQVAEWIGVSMRKFERMDVPCIYLGTKTRRYLAKDVIRWLEARRIAT